MRAKHDWWCTYAVSRNSQLESKHYYCLDKRKRFSTGISNAGIHFFTTGVIYRVFYQELYRIHVNRPRRHFRGQCFIMFT